MAGIARDEFRDEAKAINVRRKTGTDYGCLLSAVEWGGVGDEPTG
jgi:hypothetical protein